ncbi:hypothetical protein ACLB2K_073032 [Fragaria x ananassa]
MGKLKAMCFHPKVCVKVTLSHRISFYYVRRFSLLCLIRKLASQGLLKGINICEGTLEIQHLIFTDDSLLLGTASQEECHHIKEVLEDYAKASGQLVNFGKSSIVYSRSLGVSVLEKHIKYLGMPTYVGRSKTETFAYIKERSGQKLEGWQNKILSGAGKYLLIRVVAQALPSYSMSCFLLPKSFCASLHQKCARFWWGSKQDDRKIHCMSWERLCRPKDNGGMGFRDLYAHNLALLAKQGWRILKFPHSIIARLLRARYFLNGDFWSASAAGGSTCWKGITKARSVLARGVRWQVGNGTSIHMWDDLWIPRPFSFRPFMRGQTELRMVSDLISEGTWNSTLVTSLLSPAYWQALELLHAYASSSNQDSSVWKSIWAARVPGKIKVLAWRVRIGLGIQQHTFQAANAKTSRVTRRVLYPWKPPSIGWLKANVDRAFNNTSNNGGLGVVIRDSDGVLVGGGCVFANGRSACCAFSMSDGKEDNSGYGIVLDDIRQLLVALPGSSLRHVYGESNTLAHKAAKIALGSQLNVCWFGDTPDCISSAATTLI